MYYVAYNTSLGNALVGISTSMFSSIPDGITIEQHEGDIPDMTKKYWNTSLLKFEDLNSSRWVTPTEFMRKFTFEERLTIRALEADGDLVIKDALELMKGTKDGVNLDDPDVEKTLQYLAYVKSAITPDRIQEILK